MSMEDYNFAKAREAWATPVKIVQYNCTCGKTMKFESEHGVIAPQRTEQNFCPRCGKRTQDIHTCTPPQRTEQEPQIAINAQVVGYVEPQRTWVGLTDEEVESYWGWEDFQCGCGKGTLLEMVRDIEAALKERNT